MAENKSGSMNPWAEELFETFKWSVEQQQDDFDRLISLQKTYDNKFDKNVWPTISKIPIAWAWSTVEEAVGPAMDYLFPPQPFINLLSLKDIDTELLHKLKWALHIMMVHRMRLKQDMQRSVKDCFKVSVGYGIVEPITVTPPAAFDVVVGENATRQMEPGRPMRSLRYRYISPGKIVPYPSGVDFNGTDATPLGFFLDLYPEDQFKKMFGDRPTDGENVPPLKGDSKAIIAEARSQGFNSQTGIDAFVDAMGGRPAYIRTGQAQDEKVSIMVPVLKCYADKRHTWLFCGSQRHVLFDKEGAYDTMRKPLIKLDAWQDADRWYAMSQPEAGERTSWAKNVWFNLLYDLGTWSAKRPLVYDSDKLDRAPDFGPDGEVGIPGDVRATARFMDPQGVDTGIMSVGAEIDKIHSRITGQRDFTEKNFTRGGTLAFQDLLNSSSGRDRIRHALLQLGGLESVARQILVYMQTLGAGMDFRFQRPAYSQIDGEEYIETFEITEDDVKHALEVTLDLDSKHRRGALDLQNRIALYDRKIKSDAFDNWEVSRDLCIDEQEAERQVLPRDVVRQKQEAREAAQQEATRLGIAQEQEQQTSIGEQVAAGAAG